MSCYYYILLYNNKMTLLKFKVKYVTQGKISEASVPPNSKFRCDMYTYIYIYIYNATRSVLYSIVAVVAAAYDMIGHVI
jgi:hypothetical protein